MFRKFVVSIALSLFVVLGLYGTIFAQQAEPNALIHLSEGPQEDCRTYENQVSAKEEVCYLPEDVLLGTNSDVYLSYDQAFYSEGLIQGENYLAGPMYIYAPWGMSFWVVYEPTPEPTATTPVPTDTPTPTETATETPEVTATATATATLTPEIPSTATYTPTPEPTETMTTTVTPEPTGTVTATVTPEPTPIYVIEGIQPNCSEFVSKVLENGGSCYVPENVVVTTTSDVYVTADAEVFEAEFHKNGGSFTGPVWVYAPWGASFTVKEEATPTPEPTESPVIGMQSFLPSVHAPVPGPAVVLIFEGQPLNCLDFRTTVAPANTVCKADTNLKTDSDLYMSPDFVFTEDELRTGANKTFPTGQVAYLPYGGSFYE